MELESVSQGNTNFSHQLHGKLKVEHPGNLIYSPFSLSAVVAMAKIGAKGSTSDEMKDGMKFPEDDKVLAAGYSKVLNSFQESNDGYTLKAANGLFSQDGFVINPEFNGTLVNSFRAEAKQLDFGRSADAAHSINEWVKEQTGDKIKDLISPDSLGALTRLVLVNGVYFKGLWKDQFKPNHTEEEPFWINETEQVQVQMMNKEAKFPLTSLPDLDATAVALPYKGDRLTFLIILPNQINGLARVESGLRNIEPKSILSQMYSGEKVRVSLPRFKVESTINLVKPLQELGLSSMFDSNTANFSGISSTQLYVSEVVQKAFIEVNEEGSEAAAATGMVMMNRSLPMIIPFKANHPFLFQIIDTKTHFILFSGICADPTRG